MFDGTFNRGSIDAIVRILNEESVMADADSSVCLCLLWRLADDLRTCIYALAQR